MSVYTLAKKAVISSEAAAAEAQAVETIRATSEGLGDAKIQEVYDELRKLAREDTDKVTRAFTKYIPTESIALYLAILPAIGSKDIHGWIALVAMALATPVILLLVASRIEIQQSKLLPKSGDDAANPGFQPLVFRPKAWPLWKMIGATVGFIVWALAIPGNPALTNADGTALISATITSAAAVVVSYILTLIEGGLNLGDD